MATYTDKQNDSFVTKLKIFLFTKAFKQSILEYLQKDKSIIREEFKNFKLTHDIAQVYSSQYYQYDDDKNILLNDENIEKSHIIVANLMDKTKYIISTTNLKYYLKDLYDDLKEDYKKTGDFILKGDFDKLLSDENCEYCGISIMQIKLLGDSAQLNNKRSETRGFTLEIDRKQPNLEYTKENCCMSCYWCNNAKTDEFLPDEFKEIARGINTVWNNRLEKSGSSEKIIFPENSDVWNL